MKIIITGGNGFLGSNVVRKLVSDKHDVYVISNNCNNIQDILPQIKYSTEYTDEIDQFQPDVVVHFGWKGGNSSKDAQHINQFSDNMQMSLDLLTRLTTLPNKPKFIGVGSFAEYGEYDRAIQESFVEQPSTLYGLTKLTLKNYVEMICSQNGMEWSWIRPCYIYGPGDVSTRLIPTIIDKCIKNESIQLDACHKYIDYLYIDDFCNYVNSLVTGHSYGVYNLSSNNEYHLTQVVELIHKLVGNGNSINFADRSQSAATSVCGNNSKIKRLSGLTTLISIQSGLQKTINFYKKQLTFTKNEALNND